MASPLKMTTFSWSASVRTCLQISKSLREVLICSRGGPLTVNFVGLLEEQVRERPRARGREGWRGREREVGGRREGGRRDGDGLRHLVC